MSDNFSIEDILKEVENMTQSHYISSDAEKAKPTPKAKSSKKAVVNDEVNQLNFFDQADFLNGTENRMEEKAEETKQEVVSEKPEIKEEEPKSEETVKEVRKEPEINENNAFKPKQEPEKPSDDFLNLVEQQFKKDFSPKKKKKPEVKIGDNGEEIIGGFTIKNTIKEPVKIDREEKAEINESKEKEEEKVQPFKPEEEVPVFESAEQEESEPPIELPVEDPEEEFLDKKALKAQKKAEKKAKKLRKKEEKAQKKEAFQEIDEELEKELEEEFKEEATSDTIVYNTDRFKKAVEEENKKHSAFIEHKPEHLLSADEIKNNSINETDSFNLGENIKNITKPSKSTSFAKGVNKTKDNELEQQFKRPDSVKKDEELDEIKQTEKFQTEREENNEISSKGNSIPLSANIDYQKYIDEDEIKYTDDKKEDVPSQGKKFAVKKSRIIEEKTFDYSEDESSDEDVIDDYSTIEDEEPVKFDLELSYKKVSHRLVGSVLIFIVSFVLTALPSMNSSLISAISPVNNFTGFLVVNATCLLAVIIANASSIFRGLGSFFSFKPDADSPLSIATLFVAAQSAIAFVPDLASYAKNLPYFTSALAFGFVMTLIGKKNMIARIKENFRLVANQNVKESCFIADERMGELLESDDFVGTPTVACSKSVLNLHNYLRNSYCEDPADSTEKLFSRIGFVASVITIVLIYLTTKDIVKAISFGTAVAVVSAPVSVIWAVNSAIKKASDRFRTNGGMISGYNAVEEFSETDCVAIKSAELFPAGSIELLSLHAMGDHSIEDIILKSASLTISAGGPLADVFDKIIDGRRKMLFNVTDIVYEDGLGLSGKIDGRTVRIGNRKLIDSYGIYGLDDNRIEQKAQKEGFFVVYTAVDDEVGGMFAIKYKSVDPDIEDGLIELVNSGVTIAVKSNDPNVTPELIERVFEIPKEYVVVMPSHSVEYYDSLTRPSKNGNGMLSYPTDRFSVFAMLISACKKLKSKISFVTTFQSILTVLGFSFCMFCAVLKDSFDFITPSRIVLYQLAVGLLTIFFSSIIKKIK